MKRIAVDTGRLIKELRLKKGMTQEELAEETRISVRSIQRIENGKVDPRAYSLRSIASALGVDFEQLNGREPPASEAGGSDSGRIWLPLLHMSGLFCLLFPPLLIWIWKRDKVKNLREHGIDVLNFQLSMLMYLAPFGILAFLLVTIPIIFLLGVFSTAVILVNTIKVINEQPYQYPLTIKILKR